MTANITLRKATTADIEAYIAIDRKVGSRRYMPMLEEKEVLEYMAKGPVYMITRGEEVVGTVSYEIKEDESVYISGLAVDPKYQGQGIGRETLRRILEEVKDARKVELLTHPDNANAINLYESFGFKVTGRKENHFGDREPRIVLTLVRGQ
ncbi:GNAT family N-acetyltransferase [Candidatus Kaiserbacteria bacterium]|nr:GNAT family N-acetyltransferase [Candidatus Kaiserbacteria bacterium]